MEIIDSILENKIKYANESDKIEFITDNIKGVSSTKIYFLESKINRGEAISKFALLLKDIDLALKLEAGVFEFTLVYANTRNYLQELMSAIYNDKIYELIQNLDDSNSLQNKTLTKALLDGSILAQSVAFLRPQDLHPDRWNYLIKKANLKEEKKKNMAVTDLYQCWKCKERRCRVSESQTRGADEAITKFITCLNCYTVMKK